jgi:hypothetical protein
VFDPLTRFQCCPPTCGAAAAVVCSAETSRSATGWTARVVIAAQAMTTDTPSTFETADDMRRVVGYDMAASAAQQVYASAGIGPEDVDVVELHDCFTANELITYEALGLTAPRHGRALHRRRRQHLRRPVVTNPSGGLLSKGHPLGATGLAQCAELTRQLRGQAEQRQVEGARWRCSTTWAWAAPAWSRCTRAGEGRMIDRPHRPRHCRRSRSTWRSGRLRFFAKAIGQTDPVYTDEAAARAAGHPACRCRPPSCSAWRWTRPTRRAARLLGSTSAAQAAARRAALHLPPPWPMPATR